MLAVNDKDKCYAVSKKEKIVTLDLIPKTIYDGYNGIKIEKWRYNPNILSNNHIVDDISLMLSLNDSKDERVQSSIEELKEKYKW